LSALCFVSGQAPLNVNRYAGIVAGWAGHNQDMLSDAHVGGKLPLAGETSEAATTEAAPTSRHAGECFTQNGTDAICIRGGRDLRDLS